jgi:hypothetical protein
MLYTRTMPSEKNRAPECDDETLRAQLRSAIDEADFAALAPHMHREALLLVAPTLGLLDCAMAIASNRTQVIAYWLNHDLIRKPTAAELTTWLTLALATRFRFIIVQPFVVAQLVAD